MEADSVTEQKFGFRMIRLAGYDVTTALVDSGATINKKVT